jgi:hypothetical protein
VSSWFEGAEEFRKVADARRRTANADPRGMGTARPERGEAFGNGIFEGEDPDEDVYRGRGAVHGGGDGDGDDSTPFDIMCNTG